jgi:hypothetical protein
MALKPGTVDDFAGSMAEAMDEAFKAEWLDVKGTPLQTASGEEDRKILFAAISKGVVRHLKEKVGAAFQIDVQVTQTSDVLVQSENPATIPTTSTTTIQPGRADVAQINQPGNMMISEGTATIVDVLTDE